MEFHVDLTRMLDEVKLLVGGEELKSELELMKRLLRYAQAEDERVCEIFDEVRKVCVCFEDLIETYVINRSKSRMLNFISDVFRSRKLEADLSMFKQQIRELNGKLLELLCCGALVEGAYDRMVESLAIDLDEDVLVGIEKKKKMVGSLLQEFAIVSICGVGGIGKTTLAREMFMDEGIRREFEAFAWVTVSQDFHMKSILQDILLQLYPSSRAEVEGCMDIELAQKLHKSLQSRKYLIVLDDIWSEDAWDNLKICLPTGKSASRILITARAVDLAKRIAVKGVSFQMKALSDDDSWQLFLKKQSSDFKPNQALEEIGKDVVKKCAGLPLAIVTIGGLLARKHTVTDWNSVRKTFDSYLYRAQSSPEFSSIQKVLCLSYENLPYHLQNCFLYTGLFPEDKEIKAEKLINLWLAEGLISSDNGGSETTMSDTAERYLNELVMRNLIFVQKEDITRGRRVKSCRIHGLLREMCLLKGKEENIFEVLDLKRRNFKTMDSYPSMVTSRRLSVYLNMHEAGYDIFFQHKAYRKVRSLLFLNPYPCRRGLSWPRSFSLKNFRLLRVLDFDAISFQGTKLPEGIENLTNLKYLSLRDCYLKELPSSIGNLSSLWTLDLRVCGGFQMTLPNVLWKLKNLRHLYLPCSYQVQADDKLRLHSHRLLETLENFDSSHCDSKDLLNLYNLRYLVAATEGSVEDLEVIVKCMNVALDNLQESSLDLRNFDCYSKKRNSAFEKVLAIRTLHTLHMDGHLSKLPELITPNLTKIFFGACEFTEDPMARLEKLPKLLKLVLHNGAFIGKQMVCSTSGFPCLKRLKLSNLQKLEKLTIEEGALPKLSILTLERCKNLVALPDGLMHLSSLQQLDVSMMPETFVYRHQKEGKDFYKVQHIPQINLGSSRWFISWPDSACHERIRIEKS